MNRVPFNRAEIDNAIITSGFMGMPVKKFQTPITPRENYRLVYERKMPFWLPEFGDILMLAPRIDPDNIARCFVTEANPLTPDEIDNVAKNGYKDKFGVEWVYIPSANGSMVRPGAPMLTDVNDWKKVITFPNIENWDWEGSKSSNADFVNTDKFLSTWIFTGFFERLISWMDFEGAAMAIIDDDQKDAIHEVFNALADLYIKLIDKFIWAYGIDQISLHDDWGSQRAPFFSLSTAREMIVPHLKKVVDYSHSRNLFFDMHSCGKNELLVPAYIEAGCDSWSGQPMNDKQKLYEQYGGKIILGVEPDLNIEPAPPGIPPSPELVAEAKASAKRFVEKYCGKQYLQKPIIGGLVFGTPPEYTDTLYEESRKAFNS